MSELQALGKLRPHKTSRREVSDLLRLAERNLSDAQVEGVSADGRFRFAYEAAIALASIAIQCAGFRTSGVGHHQTTLVALPLAMGAELTELAGYFDTCRTKRNASVYDRGGEISDSQVAELVREVAAFRVKLIAWLKTNHPEFSR